MLLSSFLKGQKKYHANFLKFFTGSIILFYGQYCEIFSSGRVFVFVELKIDFLYKVAVWSENFCFCSCIRVVFHWHFFVFFDGLNIQ